MYLQTASLMYIVACKTMCRLKVCFLIVQLTRDTISSRQCCNISSASCNLQATLSDYLTHAELDCGPYMFK